LIVLYILLILLLLILLTPVGIHGQYSRDSYLIAARVLFFDIKLISSDDKEEDAEKEKRSKAKKKKESVAKKEPDKAETLSAEKKPDVDKNQNEELSDEVKEAVKKSKQKPAFELNEIIDLLFLALDILGKFKQKLIVNKFKLHFISASNDPYETVMYFKLAGMILEALKAFSKKTCILCSVDIETGMDFEASEPIVDLDIVITINLIRILAVLTVAGFGFLKIRKAYKNKENINNEGTINYGSTK